MFMKKLYYLFVCLILLVFSSCKKNAVDNETVSTTDYALVSQEFIQLSMNMNESAIHQKGLYDLYSAAVISAGRIDSLSGDTTHDVQGAFTNITNLPTLWLQYANYTGPDGKIRNGT